MKKRIVSFFLPMAVLICSLPLSKAVYAETVFNEKFDGYQVGSSLVSPWQPGAANKASGNTVRGRVAAKGDGSDNYLSIKPLDAWPYHIRRAIDKKSDFGLYKISYDIMVNNAVNAGQLLSTRIIIPTEKGADGNYTTTGLRIGDMGSVIQNGTRHIYFDCDNKIKASGSWMSGSKTDIKKFTKDGEWHTVTVFIDFENRKETVFFDKQVWYNGVDLPDEINNISCVDIWSVTNGESSPVETGIDNFSVEALEYQDVINLKNNGESCPEYLVSGMTADILSENTGNIFFDKDVCLKLRLKNLMDNITDGFLINICDLENNCVYTEKIEKEFTPGEVFEYDFQYSAPYYGLYNISVSHPNGIGIETAPFSVCNPPLEDVKNAKLGIDTDFDVANRGKIEEIMPLIDRAGFGFVREQFTWQTLDADGTGFKMTDRYEEFTDAAQAAGTDIMAIAGFGNTNYLKSSPPETADEIAEYANYCKELAKSLEGKSGYIEIWNEYMLTTFNNASLPPEKYAEMLVAAYDAIKLVNKEIKVCSMVLPGVTYSIQSGSVLVDTDGDGVGEKLSALSWMELVLDELVRLNRTDCFDAISVHIYPDTYPDDLDNVLLIDVERLKDSLKKYGLDDIPIVVSESGWSTCYDYVSDEMQASALVRTGILNGFYDLFEKYAIFNIQAFSRDAKNRDGNFGILNYMQGKYANNARPAYVAICNFNRIMAEAQPVEKLERAENVMVYKFETNKNEDLYTIWTLSGETQLRLDIGKPYAIVCDMYGNEKCVSSDNGVLQLVVDETVRYITVPLNQSGILTSDGKLKTDGFKPGETVKIYAEKATGKDFYVFTESKKNETTVYDVNTLTEKIKADKINTERIETKTPTPASSKVLINGKCQAGNTVTAMLDGINPTQYQWQYADHVYDSFEDIAGETSASLKIGDSIAQGGYIRLKASVNGIDYFSIPMRVTDCGIKNEGWIFLKNVDKAKPDDYTVCEAADPKKTFTFLDKKVKNGESLYFIMRKDIDTALNGKFAADTSVMLDPASPGNAAYTMNTAQFIDAAVTSGMKECLKEADWKVNAALRDSYKIKCRLMLLGTTEVRNYINRIDYSVSSNWWLRDQSFEQGGGTVKQTYITPSDKDYIRTHDATEYIFNLRPCFYLTREYFRTNKLDLSKTGKAVIRMLAQDYLRTELSDIYTEAELDIIYKDAVDVSLEACGEYTVGTDTNEVTFFVFEKGTWMPLMDKITININQ